MSSQKSSTKQSPSTKLKILDIILSILQMCSFTASFVILLYFRITTQNNQNSQYMCSYRQVILVSVGLFIKIIRMLSIKNIARKIALSQIKFYTPYLLTIMQCVFKYFSQPHQHATQTPLNLFLIFLIIKNIYYSFLTHEKLTSFIQALIASLTLVAWVTLGVYSLMTSVYQFDNQVDNDYKKDLVLLFLTTLIANGAMMMDLIFRPVEELIKEKEEEEEKKEKEEKQNDQTEEKQLLNNKKNNGKKECPHCNNDNDNNAKQHPQPQVQPLPTCHQPPKNRSKTSYPPTSHHNQTSKKTKLQPLTNQHHRYSINQQFSQNSSSIKQQQQQQVNLHNVNDSSREIELRLIDKKQLPRMSTIY